MGFFVCYSHSPISLKADRLWLAMRPCHTLGIQQRSVLGSLSTGYSGQRVARIGTTLSPEWSFVRGLKVVISLKVARCAQRRKNCGVVASYSQIASTVFTLGTVAVLPFYSLMVLAPKARLTRRSMESGIPYALLGLLYAYVLYLSWTPDTIRIMFASKYWLPELPGIARLFSNEMTLASAWIHLLVVDLFAARQVFLDGLENNIETRHSVSLCLMFCPVGIFAHVITKALSKRASNVEQNM
ncbi:hypothetical protein GIB67_012614 [Kingdonia uniflora]|uniref:Neoxanthin synthase n=1 Tax=Kingdonia uniflora TaxID=39325 RepID=A0A7J7NEY1_9MAGN|nr:hypothetical protein GIB67_012614 [Kingdonia uniflora]